MSHTTYTLENGNVLIVDSGAVQHTISKWAIESRVGDIRRYAAECLEFEIERRKRDEALKRSESDDATVEREALCSYMESTLKDSVYMPPQFFFEAIRIHKIHHRKRSGT